MQLVAREMNVSETAFVHPTDGGWSLRWFTPTTEIALCGHATLASAHILWETGALSPTEPARFSTRSGWLTCRLDGNWIEMDFPALPVNAATAPAELLAGLRVNPGFVGFTGCRWLVEVASEEIVRSLRPDFQRLSELSVARVVVTARSATPDYDFVSRNFAPASGVNEDAVTGSAHCALGPYWQSKLGKSDFVGYQASARGGVVKVGVRADRVLLGGQAITVSRVELLRSASMAAS
jgi:PhzF family phenazine biosynthesis protein